MTTCLRVCLNSFSLVCLSVCLPAWLLLCRYYLKLDPYNAASALHSTWSRPAAFARLVRGGSAWNEDEVNEGIQEDYNEYEEEDEG